MKTVFLIPGLLGSELTSDSVYGDVLWVNPTRLALGQLGQLGLSANGVDPLPPDGRTQAAGLPLIDYYGPMLFATRSALRGHDYAVVEWGFDWRKDIVAAGTALAGTIKVASTTAEPATLVGHSLGGLVARLAWFALASEGKADLIRRIVTVGTPHQGSYGIVKVWSLVDELIDQVQLVVNVPVYLNPSPLTFIVFPPWSARDIADLTASFPAFYQLLPLLYEGYEEDDPFRARIYNAANWRSGVGISQDWLDSARDTFGAILRDPASMPPKEVLTTVAGTGVTTPAKLDTPDDLGRVGALGFSEDGDGRVLVSSALVPQSSRYEFPGVHGTLQLTQWFADNIGGWILEERGPLDPVPPVAASVGPVLAGIAGPPLTAAPSGGSACVGSCLC